MGLWEIPTLGRIYFREPVDEVQSLMHFERYGSSPKTVAKWNERLSVADRPTWPREARSTVLASEKGPRPKCDRARGPSLTRLSTRDGARLIATSRRGAFYCI